MPEITGKVMPNNIVLLDQICNTPHMVTRGRLDALAAFAMARNGIDITVPDQPTPMAFGVPDSAEKSGAGYMVDSGIAIIDMIGTLVHRGGGVQSSSGLMGYTGIGKMLKRAAADPNVNAILLNTDSPGGAVAGAFALSDDVAAMRGVKPVYSLASDTMASAAYLTGSAAAKTFVTRTAAVGSIGVVMKHIDLSKLNESIGINSTYIFAGDYKVDGNPDEPLSDEVKARFQADIDKYYGMFVENVALQRDMEQHEVIATKAGMFIGQDAVDAGLADEVVSGDALLERMKTEFGTANKSRVFVKSMEKPMTEEVAASLPESDATVTVAERDAAVATAVAEENGRWMGILNHEAAVNRMPTAVKLADSGMAVDAAVAALETVPETIAASGVLDTLMAGEDSPDVSAEDDSGEVGASNRMLSNYNAATGRGGDK